MPVREIQGRRRLAGGSRGDFSPRSGRVGIHALRENKKDFTTEATEVTEKRRG